MEGADQVLALLGVDPGLAADRRIDLGEERGRHLHDADAAPQDARGEAGQVADHAAAKGDDAVAALDAELEQALAKRSEHGKALACLSGLDHHLAEQKLLLSEARFERGKMQRRHIGVGHHGSARALERARDPPAGRGEQVLADDDGIAPPGKLDLDDCLALARGESGRAVAHCHTFLQPWTLARSFLQPSLAASASITAVTITSWGTSRLSTVTSASA